MGTLGAGLTGGLADKALKNGDVRASFEVFAHIFGSKSRPDLVVGADKGHAFIGAAGVDEHNRDTLRDGGIDHRSERVGIGGGQRDAVHALGDQILDLVDLGLNVRFLGRGDNDHLDAMFFASRHGAGLDGGPERIARTGAFHAENVGLRLSADGHGAERYGCQKHCFHFVVLPF